MVNSKEFSKRLQKIMNYYGLSASAFADKIGVQRSSISHILSGRNKPSLEFVTKILTSFPEVDLYWLLNGKGEFPSSLKATSVLAKNDDHDHLTKEKTIERIVVFYSDGSFKNYEN